MTGLVGAIALETCAKKLILQSRSVSGDAGLLETMNRVWRC